MNEKNIHLIHLTDKKKIYILILICQSMLFIIILKFLYSFIKDKTFENKAVKIRKIRKTSEDDLIINPITVGEAQFNFVNLAKKTNGDFCLETSSYPGNTYRYFYCLNQDGSYPFKDENNKDTPYFLITSDSISRYNAELSSVVYNGAGEFNEQFISLELNNSYIEIYDFSTGNTQELSSSTLVGFSINEISSNAIAYKYSDNYYLFFCFLSDDDSSGKKYFILQKIFFSQLGNNDKEVISQKETGNRNMASFFITDEKLLVCFYTNNEQKYYISIYDETFDLKEELEISSITNDDPNLFYKSIYLNNEIGVFVYYIDKSYTGSKPYFQIKKFNQESDGNITVYDYFDKSIISIEKSFFSYEIKLNDITKIKDDNFVLTTISKYKKMLLVVYFYKSSDSQFNIYYWEIKLYDNYSIRLYNEIKSISYNNFLTIGYSYCNQEKCDDENDNPRTSLLILNYPNVTDNYINAADAFNNRQSISISIKKLFTIENNLFNYESWAIVFIDFPDYIKMKIEGFSIGKGDLYLLSDSMDSFLMITFNDYDNNETFSIEFYVIVEEKYGNFKERLETIDIYSDNIIEDDYEVSRYNSKVAKIYICISLDCPVEFEKSEETEKKETEQSENSDKSEETEKSQDSETTIPTTITNDSSSNHPSSQVYPEINKCSNDDILNNICFAKIDEKQLEKICDVFRNKIVNENIEENTIIQTDNTVIQIAPLNTIKTQNNPNVSNIDLGECEKILKKECGTTKDLLIFKLDLKFDDSSKRYVQYEVLYIFYYSTF